MKDEKAEIKQFQMEEESPHRVTLHALIVFYRAPLTLPPRHHQSLIFFSFNTVYFQHTQTLFHNVIS